MKQLNNSITEFLAFLRFCLDETQGIPDSVGNINWTELKEFAKQQAIVGICWQGISRLGNLEKNKPTDDDVLAWMVLVQKIQKQNRKLDERTAFVSKTFRSEGFPNCILKGQGNALYYPAPHLRSSGDIDIWLNGSRKAITRYVKKICPKSEPIYLHIDFPAVKGATVEVHYKPSYVNNFFANRRLQRWFENEKKRQMAHYPNDQKLFPTPTDDFNLVFQLCHVMHHIFDEGIGLRQLIDYYYLLRSATDVDREALRNKLSSFGLRRFARAIMWIEHVPLGLPKEYLIEEPDEKAGRVVFDDVLRGGNFGKFNDDYEHASKRRIYPRRAWMKFRHSMSLVRYFPGESLSEPLFRLWHFVWRMTNRN
mgnify:CR=1 FL=1